LTGASDYQKLPNMKPRKNTIYLEPAARVIRTFGGRSVVAEICGVTAHHVHSWMRPREVGGTDGRIPTKHQAKLLQYAEKHKLPLKPRDFITA